MLEFLPALLRGALVTVQITLAASLVALVIGVVVGLAKLSTNGFVRAGSRLHRVLPRHLAARAAVLVVLRAAPFRHLSRAHGGRDRRDRHERRRLWRGGGARRGPGGAARSVRGGDRAQHVARGAHAPDHPAAGRARDAAALGQPFELLKGTALVSLITIHDLTFIGHSENMRTFRTVEIFTLVLVIYYLLGRALITPSVRWLERHFSRGLGQRRSA